MQAIRSGGLDGSNSGNVAGGAAANKTTAAGGRQLAVAARPVFVQNIAPTLPSYSQAVSQTAAAAAAAGTAGTTATVVRAIRPMASSVAGGQRVNLTVPALSALLAGLCLS